jgi:hypothetical protein
MDLGSKMGSLIGIVGQNSTLPGGQFMSKFYLLNGLITQPIDFFATLGQMNKIY